MGEKAVFAIDSERQAISPCYMEIEDPNDTPITPLMIPKGASRSAMLRVATYEAGVSQMQEYFTWEEPREPVLIYNLPKGELSDSQGDEILTGFISVHIKSALIPPASLILLSQLLKPFEGFWVMVLEGSYETSGPVTTVTVDKIYTTNIQPIHREPSPS